MATKDTHLTAAEEKALGYNQRLIEQCRDIVRRVNEAAVREKLAPPLLKKAVITAALLCMLQNVKDPQSGKQGWLIKCEAPSIRQTYIASKFHLSKRAAVHRAKDWLNAQRPPPAPTVNIEALRAGR